MDEQRSLSGAGTVALVSALILAEVTGAFETIMIVTALKALLEEYGRPAAVGWLISGYLLIAAAAAAICGRLGDLYGRRTVLLLLLLGAAGGSLISLLAPSLEWVLVGRAVQGLSGALMPLGLGLARQLVSPRRLNMSVALITASASLGSGLGMIIGGVIVDTVGWRHVFSASFVLALASFAACFWAVPRAPVQRPEGRLDLWGGLLFVPAIAGMLLAISNGVAFKWDYRVWGLLAGSLALLTVWVRHERRHENPLIDVGLLSSRHIALPNIAGAVSAVGVLQFSPLMLLLMQQPKWTGVGLGLSATFAAMLKAPGNFLTMAASPLWGYLADRWGPSRVIVLGMVIMTGCCAGLLFGHSTLWAVVLAALIGTIAVSATYAAVPTLLVRAAPLGRVSETVGIGSVIRSVGMAFGSQIMLILLATETVSNPAQGRGEFPTLDSYQLTFSLMGVTAVLTLLIALAIPRGSPGPEAATPAASPAGQPREPQAAR